MSDTRKCIVCGKEYDYCPNCIRYIRLPRWMFSYHDENCRKIGAALNDYKAKNKTPIEVKRMLEQADLSKKETFVPAFKEMIDEVLAVEEPKEVNVEAPKDTVPMQKKYNNSESKFNKKK